MEVVDLFCGCGGFSLGSSQAGASVILAVEADEKIAQVYRNNFDHRLDVVAIGPDNVDEYVDFVRAHPNVHLHGSPPCQKLSQVNKTNGDVSEGMRLVRLFLDIVERARPRTWTMEQVNEPSLRAYLTSRGVAHTVVNAADFGTPQSRRRIVAGTDAIVRGLVEKRDTGPTTLPMHVLEALRPWAEYKLLNGTDNQPLRQRSDKHTITVGHRPKRPSEGSRELDLPAHTVWSKPGKVYSKTTDVVLRVLTPQECARLQGFPSTFVLDERSKTRSHKVVGNAVPPPLARAIVELAAATT